MTKESIFNNAYPFVLPEDQKSMIDLEDVTIPPKNIVARLNDQWVKEIGLDMKKFGYGYSLKDLLDKKIGEKVHKNNLLEKIRILQTIGSVFSKLNPESKKKTLNFIEQEPILYPNFRGSRDQTFFHHRKQLTVVLLEILLCVKDEMIKKSILDIIFDIIEDNFSVVKRKTYFDEYNSYTYSEEQRQIAKTIVTGIEKKLLSCLNLFSKDERIVILRKLWMFPMLQNDFDLKKKIIKEIYISDDKDSFIEIRKVIDEMEKTFAPELDVLKEVAMEESVKTQNVDAEQIIKFYHENLKDDNKSSGSTAISENIDKIFQNAKNETEKKNIIQLLIFQDDSNDNNGIIDGIINKKKNYLPLVGLFVSNYEASKMIFKKLILREHKKQIFKDLSNQLEHNKDILNTFKEKLAFLLTDAFNKTDIETEDEDVFIDNVVEIIKNDLMDEITGKKFIDVLFDKKETSKICDTILQKIFQKGHESDLGRYLQYILLSRK